MTTTPTTQSPERCRVCTAQLAADQRYCLECGEVRPGAGRSLPAALRRPAPPAPAAAPAIPAAAPAARAPLPSQTVLLAGLACLLLAMGVGVLIGRGGETATPAPITVAGTAAGATPAAAAGQTFTSDWPADREGWTIALQTLPKASTQPAAVAAAKAAAVDKGASKAGALDSDAYPSLTGGSYVVYSGVYSSRDTAGGALGSLKPAFAGATIVQVSKTAAGAGAAATKATKDAASKPATSPSTSKSSEESAKQGFEETKKAPKTLGTGGKPPPKDNKPAAGGGGFEDIG